MPLLKGRGQDGSPRRRQPVQVEPLIAVDVIRRAYQRAFVGEGHVPVLARDQPVLLVLAQQRRAAPDGALALFEPLERRMFGWADRDEIAQALRKATP